MDDIPGKIIENGCVAAGYRRLRVSLERPLGKVSPGQFVMLKIPDGEIFLRRPFSIYNSQGRTLTVVYRVVGKGTDALSAAGRKAPVMVLGPLGHGFTVTKGTTRLVVAGGIGYAGVRMLLRRLGDRATLFLGVTGKEELRMAEDLEGPEVFASTMDGSSGFAGDVVGLLGQHLGEYRGKSPEVFACGPQGMVKSLKTLLEPHGIPCQVSVEERMACGMGLCFGCVVATRDEASPYKRVCKEGPVFSLWDLSL
ncbi:MAG: dihydroorotate dehydrogenase electron transfer subunit [Syntrophorhabdaceae bacterium]|nr:dihydroorotate dehydrogenase electron transfer subunit [Syntrophorhabdaceae bacterium]